MDERPDAIIGHIESQRDELGRNLNELETRVRRSTDWRTYYERNPMMMLGAALGGGLLIGTMVGSKQSDSPKSYKPKKSSASSSYSSAAMGLSSAGVGASAASNWSKPSSEQTHTKSSLVTSEQWRQVSQTMDHIKGALIAFGIEKAREFMSQAVPGLDRHLHQQGGQHQHGGGQHQHSGGTQHHDQNAQHFADSGAFAQPSGGSQSTNDLGLDPYSQSGQFETQGSQGSQGQGGGDYFSGNRGTSSSSDAGQHSGDQVPTHQY